MTTTSPFADQKTNPFSPENMEKNRKEFPTESDRHNDGHPERANKDDLGAQNQKGNKEINPDKSTHSDDKNKNDHSRK